MAMAARWSAYVVCLSAVVPGTEVSATMIPTWPATLTSEDRQSIDRVACRQAVGVGAGHLKAYRYQPSKAAPIEVEVICKPHRQMLGQPVRSGTDCTKSNVGWTCGERTEYLEIAGSPKATLLTMPSPANAELGLGAVKYLLTLGSFKGWSVQGFVDGQMCNTAMGPTKEPLIRCGMAEFWVAHDCTGSGQCSYRLFDMSVAIP